MTHEDVAEVEDVITQSTFGPDADARQPHG